ncbi:MAG: response regulator transcription factor [Oscillospiraceae bacterium]|nr:response regulator transcription factor [Oscillospiraceae bacterium]
MYTKPIIFAVEDDAAIAEAYSYSLENEFIFTCFSDGKALFDTLNNKSTTLPDIILLDIMLPGDDGYAILMRLKSNSRTLHIPVIMISAKGEEISKVKGLNMGADDYLAKPLGVMELVARLKAHLRKSQRKITISETENIVYKDIFIDVSKYEITANGVKLQTALKEFQLFCMLCKNPEKALSREAIFEEVWTGNYVVESRTLDCHIKEIRKKLAEADSETVIKTIRGVGYMLE